jgi:hypothetical protein
MPLWEEGIMIRTLLLGLLLSIAAMDGASAQGRSVYGFASFSCGQWQQLRTAKDVGSLQLEAYVAGYLSGYNMASTGPDFIAGSPNDKGVGFYAWIDNYCRSNPLDVLSQAMMGLKNELEARARR